MHFSISEKLKPFDHKPGTKVLLPGSHLTLEIFPALIVIYDLSHSKPKEIGKILTHIEGPVSSFTIQLNLEKGNVLVFGHGLKGYFSYSLTAIQDGEQKPAIAIKIERDKGRSLVFTTQTKQARVFLQSEESQEFNKELLFKPLHKGRLSLGNHKVQDWNLVLRRGDLKEILPVWLSLGQSLSNLNFLENDSEGTLFFLKKCEELVEKRDLVPLLAEIYNLFQVAFEGLMVPSLFDIHHQGIFLKEVKETTSPLNLLSQGAKLIRHLFLKFENNTLEILRSLPPEFNHGRFLHFQAGNLGRVDLEWSKKMIRRMIFFGQEEGRLELKWQKEIKRFRMKEENSKLSQIVEVGHLVKIEKGKTYFFDRFEK